MSEVIEGEEPQVTKKYDDGLTFPCEISRVVKIYRKNVSGGLPDQDYSESKSKIGSSFKNGGVLRGLSFPEEVAYLKDMLGVNPENNNWEKVTREYWANISTDVPYGDAKKGGGLSLEVGFKYLSREDYEWDKERKDINGVVIPKAGDERKYAKGIPLNIANFILWRYCLVYSCVANSIEDIGKSPKIQFYLYNKDKEINEKKATLKVKQDALKLLYSRISDRDWVSYMLRVLVSLDKREPKKIMIKDIDSINNDEKDVLLDEYATENPARFLSVGNDKNLEMKSFIETCVAMGYLTRIPNTDTIVNDDNLPFGNTLEETVAFLNNPKNVNHKNTLKAKLAHNPK